MIHTRGCAGLSILVRFAVNASSTTVPHFLSPPPKTHRASSKSFDAHQQNKAHCAHASQCLSLRLFVFRPSHTTKPYMTSLLRPQSAVSTPQNYISNLPTTSPQIYEVRAKMCETYHTHHLCNHTTPLKQRLLCRHWKKPQDGCIITRVYIPSADACPSCQPLKREWEDSQDDRLRDARRGLW